MVHTPRWLTLATLGVMAVLLLTACTPAAGPTNPPATATATPPAATNPPATGTPGAGTPEPGTPEPGTPEPGTPEPPTAPPATAYPAMGEPASDPATIADSYPNYGGAVDCDAGTFNGLPYSGTLESITAPDPLTVVFDLCAPDVAFLSKIAFTVFAINDSEYLIEHAAAGDLKDGLNGTGPLKFDQWQRGTEINYSRFDGYWGDPAATATAVLRWITEPAGRLQELQAGTIHGMTNVGPTDFETVSGNADLQLVPAQGGGLNTLYLGMNHNYAPWDNEVVRQALAIGIDRAALRRQLPAARIRSCNPLHPVLDPIRLRGRRVAGHGRGSRTPDDHRRVR